MIKTRAASVSIPVIAIVGPTGVGKSHVADLVAAAMRSEVISADAMQVYRGMDIGTAKMPAAQRRAPLRLIDIVDPTESYSAALYQKDARQHIERLLADGSVPVVCGGTGLYVRAALDDCVFPPGEKGDRRRRRYEALAARKGDQAVYDLLARRDPDSALAIHPHNVRRVIRALEMLDQGVSYAERRSHLTKIEPVYDTVYFGLAMERSALYRRIESRVDAMIAAGLIAEVQQLVNEGVADALTSRQAIGYNEIIQYLMGEQTMEASIAAIKMRTRRYAKRQMSWFGRDQRIEWIHMDELRVEEAAHMIVEKMGRSYDSFSSGIHRAHS
ncbi:tRNA delta(2)-isopentenylpyrophosphate transferase [Coriobacterium glomerans PW2]|uniref:tRNA dimethylallyltransferase n=1 Tax=Coriobacterium glomerans (strain ATCC 49209 / DSM 20642 / JCM 10262 / PW2) TaxID=700015 RepID=F2N7X4_CORGP|nr:tRNA (adenosine(37)-N6)-dimethylallyltransferase MiaA [Coriobacterium glomerans]AEB07083.1 tRNA delta(2)-isopentenylpyrophosphate transferase [Coriobacterium glomerans PW2]